MRFTGCTQSITQNLTIQGKIALIKSDKVVKQVGGGSVINGVTLFSFSMYRLFKRLPQHQIEFPARLTGGY